MVKEYKTVKSKFKINKAKDLTDCKTNNCRTCRKKFGVLFSKCFNEVVKHGTITKEWEYRVHRVLTHR